VELFSRQKRKNQPRTGDRDSTSAPSMAMSAQHSPQGRRRPSPNLVIIVSRERQPRHRRPPPIISAICTRLAVKVTIGIGSKCRYKSLENFGPLYACCNVWERCFPFRGFRFGTYFLVCLSSKERTASSPMAPSHAHPLARAPDLCIPACSSASPFLDIVYWNSYAV